MLSEQLFSCPRCEKGKEPKLYVNAEKGIFNCFRCSFAGKISKLREYPEIYSQVEDRESLAAFTKLTLARSTERKQSSELLSTLKPFRSISSNDPEFDYLLSRGWDEDTIDCYDILVSDNRLHKNRVFITVSDYQDKVIFYTGRAISNDIKPKYKNAVVPKTFVFKAATPVDSFYTDNAYIGEGIFDVFKLPGGLALLGKTLSQEQKSPLFSALRDKKNIYICLDPGTEKESLRLAKELDSWFPTKSISILDWGTATNIDIGDLSVKMSRASLMNFIHNHSSEFTNKFF